MMCCDSKQGNYFYLCSSDIPSVKYLIPLHDEGQTNPLIFQSFQHPDTSPFSHCTTPLFFSFVVFSTDLFIEGLIVVYKEEWAG